jgi:hypothetical protein
MCTNGYVPVQFLIMQKTDAGLLGHWVAVKNGSCRWQQLKIYVDVPHIQSRRCIHCLCSARQLNRLMYVFNFF